MMAGAAPQQMPVMGQQMPIMLQMGQGYGTQIMPVHAGTGRRIRSAAGVCTATQDVDCQAPGKGAGGVLQLQGGWPLLQRQGVHAGKRGQVSCDDETADSGAAGSGRGTGAAGGSQRCSSHHFPGGQGPPTLTTNWARLNTCRIKIFEFRILLQ